MIDIAEVVRAIVKARDAGDAAAYTKHTHACVREYGQQLLLNLSAAILPTTPQEADVVNWLKGKLVEIAKQIPEHKE